MTLILETSSEKVLKLLCSRSQIGIFGDVFVMNFTDRFSFNQSFTKFMGLVNFYNTIHKSNLEDQQLWQDY